MSTHLEPALLKTLTTSTGTRLARLKTKSGMFKEIRFMRNTVALSKVKKLVAVVLMFLTLAFCVGPVTSAQTRRPRRHRTFWQKHRDKLTVAGTSLGGAGIGGLAGGKKGAAIGALAGGGSGALYTYKLRKRHRHRRY
jgi:hypothetical protein